MKTQTDGGIHAGERIAVAVALAGSPNASREEEMAKIAHLAMATDVA